LRGFVLWLLMIRWEMVGGERGWNIRGPGLKREREEYGRFSWSLRVDSVMWVMIPKYGFIGVACIRFTGLSIGPFQRRVNMSYLIRTNR